MYAVTLIKIVWSCRILFIKYYLPQRVYLSNIIATRYLPHDGIRKLLNGIIGFGFWSMSWQSTYKITLGSRSSPMVSSLATLSVLTPRGVQIIWRQKWLRLKYISWSQHLNRCLAATTMQSFSRQSEFSPHRIFHYLSFWTRNRAQLYRRLFFKSIKYLSFTASQIMSLFVKFNIARKINIVSVSPNKLPKAHDRFWTLCWLELDGRVSKNVRIHHAIHITCSIYINKRTKLSQAWIQITFLEKPSVTQKLKAYR